MDRVILAEKEKKTLRIKQKTTHQQPTLANSMEL
jgi:hypothetical protein